MAKLIYRVYNSLSMVVGETTNQSEAASYVSTHSNARWEQVYARDEHELKPMPSTIENTPPPNGNFFRQ